MYKGHMDNDNGRGEDWIWTDGQGRGEQVGNIGITEIEQQYIFLNEHSQEILDNLLIACNLNWLIDQESDFWVEKFVSIPQMARKKLSQFSQIFGLFSQKHKETMDKDQIMGTPFPSPLTFSECHKSTIFEMKKKTVGPAV